MKNQTRKHRSPQQWQALIQQWQQSELSAMAFCKQNELGYASFCQWRKRLCTPARSVAAPLPEASPFIDLGSMPQSHNSSDQTRSGLALRLNLGDWLNLSIQL